MKAASWDLVEALFEQAVAVEGTERRALLERCDDTAVRAEVERLLGSDSEDEGFLERALGGGLELLSEKLEAPAGMRQLGAYRLLHRLGVGGMGEVYLAERADREFDKRVAIKLIRPGLDSGRILDRFRRERQILASLEHPSIARLLDGGTSSTGMPYLVMEYIEGEPIDRYCDHRRLGIGERLELFLEVCAAVQFAHQSLVIHRDLKPGNILVNADGAVKLLDFGIAKLLSSESDSAVDLTRTSERPLTLAYASPEQIRGEPINTAGDVYALGCLLYELLAGCRPYDLRDKTRREAERIILEESPAPISKAVLSLPPHSEEEQPGADEIAFRRRTRPETLAKRLRGDLENIIRFAMRKERSRRYGTVEQLAEDLRRHLAGRPVQAHRDSLGYRVRKFVRRNRLPVAVVAVFVAMLGVGWLNQVVQGRRVAGERDKAMVLSDFLLDVFTNADPSHSRGADITAREILTAGAESIDGLSDQPLTRAMLGNAIGRAYRGLGVYEPARDLLESGLESRRAELGDRHPDVAESLRELGLLLYAQGDYARAATAHEEALEVFMGLRGDQRKDIAESKAELGMARLALGDFKRAIELLRDALELYMELYGDRDHEDVAAVLNNLGLALRQEGSRIDEAREMTERALRMGRRLYGDPHPWVAEYLHNLATHEQALGHLDRSRALYEEALDMRRRVLPESHPGISQTLANLGTVFFALGQMEAAEATMREAVRESRTSVGDHHPELASRLHNLGIIAQTRGSLEDVEPLLREALEIRRRAHGDQHIDVAQSYEALGVFNALRGDFAEAESRYSKAYRIFRETVGHEHMLVAQNLESRGRVLRSQGRFAEAALLQEEALEIFIEAYPKGHSRPALSHAYLGEVKAEMGELEAAVALFRKALEQQAASIEDARHRDFAVSLTGLGQVLTRLGRLDEAEAELHRALEIRRAKLAPGHWRVGETASALGACLAAQERWNEAEPLLREGLEKLEQRGSQFYLARRARERLRAFHERSGRREPAAL